MRRKTHTSESAGSLTAPPSSEPPEVPLGRGKLPTGRGKPGEGAWTLRVASSPSPQGLNFPFQKSHSVQFPRVNNPLVPEPRAAGGREEAGKTALGAVERPPLAVATSHLTSEMTET